MSESPPVIEAENLVVEYGKKKRLRAVDGISFQVRPGETVGFIGANGAGKSTTMKALMGFLFPASGAVRVFGLAAGDARSRQRIGYLPEVALYYPFMKARELLELYGGLSGMSRARLRQRIPAVLDRVGLAGRENQLLRSFSKGMQQRLGIAQALIAEPEALILDEMSSGLDPIGRHDLRDVLLELKKAGRTIFFSSHELTEVENLCDRVIIIHKGRVVMQANVADLMQPLNEFHIAFRPSNDAGPSESVMAWKPARDGNLWRIVLNDVGQYTSALNELKTRECDILQTSSRTRSLEEYFIHLIRQDEDR